MNPNNTTQYQSLISDVTNETWNSEVLRAQGLVMVIFWAPWCDPCLKLISQVQNLAHQYSQKVKIVRLNIDQEFKIASIYKISIVPTVMFFKTGQKLHEMIGFIPELQLIGPIESLSDE